MNPTFFMFSSRMHYQSEPTEMLRPHRRNYFMHKTQALFRRAGNLGFQQSSDCFTVLGFTDQSQFGHFSSQACCVKSSSWPSIPSIVNPLPTPHARHWQPIHRGGNVGGPAVLTIFVLCLSLWNSFIQYTFPDFLNRGIL